MTDQPTLRTERLHLCPFVLTDVPQVQRLVGDYAVADTTMVIPHPYPDGMAEEWIGGHAAQFVARHNITFAVTRAADGELLGAISLALNPMHHSGELGYWIGRPWWGMGFATEAGRAVLEYGFTAYQLHRIHACHMARNPASGRVMQKLGMRHEGTQKEALRRWDVFEDRVLYGLLRDEWR